MKKLLFFLIPVIYISLSIIKEFPFSSANQKNMSAIKSLSTLDHSSFSESVVSDWSAVGVAFASSGWAITIDSVGNVYTGGDAWDPNNEPNSVAKWDGNTWTPIGVGFDGPVYDLTIDAEGNIYAGGYFNIAGNVTVNSITKWDGSSWSALGGGLDGFCKSIVIDSAGIVYVGGNFDFAGGVPAKNIAKWDGSSWSPLGEGLSNNSLGGSCNTIAIDTNGLIYAGGKFTTAGLTEVHHVAKWDGSSWSALGAGLHLTQFSNCSSLAIDASNHLYAAGGFSSAGGIAAENIAKWDGNNWSPLGEGLTGSSGGYCQVIEIDITGNLYAGGGFSEAGGSSANYIAKWDGNNWSALESGFNNECYSIAVDSTGVMYAGGGFSTAGGHFANGIAKWVGDVFSVGLTSNPINSPISIFPNPTNDNLIHINSTVKEMDWLIINSEGKTVKKGKIYGSSLDISDLSTGIYFLIVYNRENSYKSKFIKF